LTTLATIGYGDLIPVNSIERIVSIFIMLIGVAMYSYVMGSFTELIGNYDRNMGIQDKNPDLQNWIILFSNFTHHNDKKLLKNIETHFSYFWKNDRNNFLSKKDPYFISLPRSVKYKLIEYLWGDVFTQFSSFFLFFSENKSKINKFYYDLSFHIMPRMYLLL
jgi:hypothetical protein